MIKRYATLPIGFLLFCIASYAQPIFTLGSGSGNPGSTFNANVSVEDFENIASMQFSVNWDPEVLSFNTVTNFNLPDLGPGNIGTPADPGIEPGQMVIGWIDNTLQGIDLPDGTVIFTIVFDVIGDPCDETDIIFSDTPSEIEIADPDKNIVGMTPVNGNFSIPGTNCGADALVVTASTESGENGENVCVQFTANNFNDIASFSFTFNFNPNIIEFTGVQNFGVPGLNAGMFGTQEAGQGRISVVWTDNTTEGVTLPDGTVMFEACFNIVGVGGQFSNITFTEDIVGIEVSNGDGQILDFTSVNGRVNVGGEIDGFTFISSSGEVAPGDLICLDISVNDFIDIVIMSFSINWDPNVLVFDHVEGFNLPNFNVGNFGDPSQPFVDPGQLTVLWEDITTNGLSVDDGTVIFRLCLRGLDACEQSTDITFTDDPLAIEVVEAPSTIIPVNQLPGSVTINCAGCGFDYQTTDPLCAGQNNGTINLIELGTCPGPITFNWSMGQMTKDLTGVGAGCYSVTISYDNNTQFIILEDICLEAPDPIEASATITDEVNGGDGAIDLMVTGGVPPYTYQWNDPNNSTTQDIGNLNAGSYMVTITDANDCILVAGPYTVSGGGISANITHVDCFGSATGAINLTVNDCGSPPYTFQWNDSNNSMTEDIANLPSGTYTVTVTDSGGSTCTESFVVDQADSPLVVNAVVTHIDQGSDGAIDLTVSGGQPPYTYIWDDLGGPGPQDRTNLDQGSYIVTVSDAFGCEEVLELFVIGDQLVVIITPSNYHGFGVSCNGECDGTLQAQVVNAVGNLTYAWSEGFNTAVVSGVCAGLHAVTVTDQGSGQTASANINISEPPPIQIDVEVDCASEPGACDGRASANVTGGVAPYAYEWNNGQGSTTATIQNQCHGQYVLFVEDANGCEFMKPVEICISGIECYKAISVITPNGDDKNDRFTIQCIFDFPTRLSVYETWTGKLEFQMNNYDNSWEGTDSSGDVLPDGGYHWVLEVFLPNNDRRVYTGTVVILRKLY